MYLKLFHTRFTNSGLLIPPSTPGLLPDFSSSYVFFSCSSWCYCPPLCSSQAPRRSCSSWPLTAFYPHPPCSKPPQLCQLCLPNISLVFLFQFIPVTMATFWTSIIWQKLWSSSQVFAPFTPPSISGQNRDIYIKCRSVCATSMLLTSQGSPSSCRINVQVYCNKCFCFHSYVSLWPQATIPFYTPVTRKEVRCTTHVSEL